MNAIWYLINHFSIWSIFLSDGLSLTYIFFSLLGLGMCINLWFSWCVFQDVFDVGCEGNILLDRLCGAHIYLVPKICPYYTHLKPRMERLAQEILYVFIQYIWFYYNTACLHICTHICAFIYVLIHVFIELYITDVAALACAVSLDSTSNISIYLPIIFAESFFYIYW